MNILYERFIQNRYKDIIDDSRNSIRFHNFRNYEYQNKLEYLIKTSLEYMVNNTNDEFIFHYEYDIQEKIHNIDFYRLDVYDVTIRYEYKYKSNHIEDSFTIRVPKISDKYFFYIYNNKYTPVIKLKNLSLRYGFEKILIETPYSLIGLDYRDSGGSFKNNNEKFMAQILTYKIYTNDFFLLLFEDDDFLDELQSYLDVKFQPSGNKRRVKNFVNQFYIFDKTGRNNLNEILTNIFFNEYSLKLIEYELGFRPKTFKDIIKFFFTELIFKENYKKSDMRDLSNRRFVFLEYIMLPFTTYVFRFLVSLSQNAKNLKFNMNRDKLISVFLVGDNHLGLKGGKYLYDYATVFTGVKANIGLQMEGDVKKFMRSIHPSYKYVICPIATSSSEPGPQIHVNPMTELSYFGHIKKLFKSYKEVANENKV